MVSGEVSSRSTTEFRSYLSAVAFSGITFSMQQLLASWLLIGVLLLPADRVGLLQAAIGLPGVLLMLLGGARADRTDARSLLVRAYALAPIFPVFLLLIERSVGVSVWSVVLWGLGMSVILSFSSPAQHALLNQVAGGAVQQGVTAATAIGFFVQMIGLTVAGQMDRIGLTPVLAVQASCIAIAALLMQRVAPRPTRDVPIETAIEGITQGFRATFRNRAIFHVLVLNVFSSVFNAGAFLTVFPFIIKRVYDGDAQTLAFMMVAFFAGAMASNLIMLKLMPFLHTGRWYLLMQLSRIPIVFLLFIRPSWWLMVVAIVSWGLNMGVTSTLARTIVQESSELEFRGRILSVYSLGLVGAPPLGAIVLGWLIEVFGTLNALIPAMCASLFLFLAGILLTGLWSYRSPGHRLA